MAITPGIYLGNESSNRDDICPSVAAPWPQRWKVVLDGKRYIARSGPDVESLGTLLEVRRPMILKLRWTSWA